MSLKDLIKATPGYQIVDELFSRIIIKVGHKFFAIREGHSYQIISQVYKENNFWLFIGKSFLNERGWKHIEEFINKVVAEQLGAMFNTGYEVLIDGTKLKLNKLGYTFIVDTTPTTSKSDVYTFGKRALDGPKQVNFDNLVLYSNVGSILYKGANIEAMLRVANRCLESFVGN